MIDNLSTGHRAAIPKGCRFVEGDIRDGDALDRAFGSGTEATQEVAPL